MAELVDDVAHRSRAVLTGVVLLCWRRIRPPVAKASDRVASETQGIDKKQGFRGGSQLKEVQQSLCKNVTRIKGKLDGQP
jgi:hypothetical protein